MNIFFALFLLAAAVFTILYLLFGGGSDVKED